MIAALGEYPFSSYAYSAVGIDDAKITANDGYLDLAVDSSARQ